MKNLFKYLSIFALAGSIGLQTTNAVQVEHCKEDEEIHTNYYMFLTGNTTKYLQGLVDAATPTYPKGMYTGADKTNNIGISNYLNYGQVTLTMTGKTDDNDKTKTWSVADYWRRFQSGAEINADPNSKTHYLFHDAWWEYSDNKFENGQKREPDLSIPDKTGPLVSYISTNFDKLEDTDLVKKATFLVDTQVHVPKTLFETTDPTNRWNIERAFNSTDVIPEGIRMGNETMVFNPAVYWVRWCSPKVAAKKTITYDKNTTDNVTGMPANQEFSDNCVNLRTERPTREGYVFKGWAKVATQTTEDYVPGQEYCDGTVTLYAVWVKKQTGPFTVTYDANGGTNAPAPVSGEAGSCIKITSQEPIPPTGLEFTGWGLKANMTVPDPTFAKGSNYCGEQGSITLYAIYRSKTGISAHLIAYGSIALIAGVGLYVAKKKNLFKQI